MKALSREHGKMKKRMDGISGLLEDTHGMDGQKVYNNDEYEKTGNTPGHTPTRGLSPHIGGGHSPSPPPPGRGSSPNPNLLPKYAHENSPNYMPRETSADRDRGHSSSRVNPKYAHESSRAPQGGRDRGQSSEMRGHVRDSRPRTRTNH